MRILKLVVINFMLVFVLTIGMNISKVEAFTFLGEFCWKMDETGSSDPPDIIKLAVSDVGGQHFILTGKLLDTGGNFIGDVLHGSAEIIGSNIIMTLSGSFDGIDEGDDVTDAFTDHVILDLNTLNGTWNQIVNSFDKSSKLITSGYLSGTIMSVSCP